VDLAKLEHTPDSDYQELVRYSGIHLISGISPTTAPSPSIFKDLWAGPWAATSCGGHLYISENRTEIINSVNFIFAFKFNYIACL
jgi:hypothetical protein